MSCVPLVTGVWVIFWLEGRVSLVSATVTLTYVILTQGSVSTVNTTHMDLSVMLVSRVTLEIPLQALRMPASHVPVHLKVPPITLHQAVI